MASSQHLQVFYRIIFILTSVLVWSIAVGFPSEKHANAKQPNDTKESRSVNDNEANIARDTGRAETPNNPLGGLQGWLSGNSSAGTMILGTYQALVMPMPRGQDIMNGINNGLQLGQAIQSLLQG